MVSVGRTAILMAGLLLLPATGHAQKTFEGTYRMKVNMGAEGGEVSGWVKGSKLRQEFSMGGSSAAMILDTETASMIMIDHARKQYMDVGEMFGLREMMQESADATVPELRPTGQKERIAGHDCEHFLVTIDGHEADMCVATDLGFYGGVLAGGPRPGASPFDNKLIERWRSRFPNGFFPLKVRLTEDGQLAELEMIQVEPKTLSDDDFKPPAGYTEARMGGL